MKGHDHDDDQESEHVDMNVDCGGFTKYESALLCELRAIRLSVNSTNRKLDKLKMLTQTEIDGQNQILVVLQQIASQLEVLISQGGGGEGGATEDEVLGLLSPIASGLQTVLDRLNQVLGGSPPPAPAFRGQARQAPRGPQTRR